MNTQRRPRRLSWYSVVPNDRPRWLRNLEDHLDKHHNNVEVAPEQVQEYLSALSTEIMDYLHNLSPPPRAKVWMRIIQGALHIYRGHRPILLILL